MLFLRPYPVMTVASILALIVLVALGNWQMRRLAWKEDLIAQVEARSQLPPVPLDEALSGAAPEDIAYTPVEVHGEFSHASEIHVFGQDLNGVPGYFVYTLLTREGRAAVIVNRGFVPMPLKDPATRPEGQVSGAVIVTGLVRTSRAPAPFQPANRPEANEWFVANLDEMAAHLDEPSVAPVFVDAGPAPNPGGWPLGGQTRVSFRNPHLAYALTWYGLAGALLAVYIAVHIGAGRLGLRRSGT